jgi:hypothetical protein
MPRNTPDKKAQRFRRGQRTIPERQLNSLVDGVNRALIGVNAIQQPRPHGKGGGGSTVVVLTLVSQADNYLVCEDDDSNEFIVAKPYELRTDPWDGNTIGGIAYSYTSPSERVADSTETQYITPSYITGGEIYAIKPQGGTGINDGASPPTDIIWLELNQGRAWAAEIEDPA